MTPSRRIIGVLGLALVSMLSAGRVTEGASFRSGAFEPPRPAPEFALPSAVGDEFRLSRRRGKVIALAFGYTNCVDVCPTVLAELAQMRARLGDGAKHVQVVYITVDPERDTSARLRAYTEQFDRTIVGLTGSRELLAAIWKAYGVSVTRREVPGGKAQYLVHHSSSVFLIDRAGRLRVMAPFGTPLDDLVHDVRTLLAAGADAQEASIKLEQAWVRRAPAVADSKTAAYVTILNRGAAPDALVSATADVAQSVELHETRTMSGMAMMERVRKLPVAPGARVELKPGGYHLMLIGLKRALSPGERVTLVLQFERAGAVTVPAEVR